LNTIYYKVIKTDTRESCVCYDTRASVTYHKNQWVKSPFENSKLMVFETLDDARNFKSLFDHLSIVQCHIKKSEKQDSLVWRAWEWRDFNRLDKPPITGWEPSRKTDPPMGTIFADEVCCTE
jgi:hypothetical protein